MEASTGAPTGGGSSEQTASAAASTPPAVTVSTGAPGTSTAAPPAAPAAASAPAAPTNTDGKWYDSYDAEAKEFIKSRSFEDPKMLVDSYRNLEKLRGVPQDRILKLPDIKGDTPENVDKAYNEIYTKLGKPATPEGYGFQTTEGGNPAFTDWAKDAFHKLNMTTEQGQKLITNYQEFLQAQEGVQNEKYVADVRAQDGELKKEWGQAYNQNVARAQAAFRQFALPDNAIKALEQTIGFDGVMKFMHSLGSKMGEQSFVSGDATSGFGEGSVLTPTEAKAKLAALKSDPSWTDRYIKGDVKARAEMDRLQKMMSPT